MKRKKIEAQELEIVGWEGVRFEDEKGKEEEGITTEVAEGRRGSGECAGWAGDAKGGEGRRRAQKARLKWQEKNQRRSSRSLEAG